MGYGRGITIGVIDSGVYGFHPDMASKRNADLTQAGLRRSTARRGGHRGRHR